jgi:hypothetical protein
MSDEAFLSDLTIAGQVGEVGSDALSERRQAGGGRALFGLKRK